MGGRGAFVDVNSNDFQFTDVGQAYQTNLTFYDEAHKQAVSIDLLHEHGKDRLKPHKHLYLDHSDNGIPVSSKELEMIRKIKMRFNLR